MKRCPVSLERSTVLNSWNDYNESKYLREESKLTDEGSIASEVVRSKQRDELLQRAQRRGGRIVGLSMKFDERRWNR